MVDSKMNQLVEYSTTKLAYNKNYPIACTITYEEDGRTVKYIDFYKLPTQTELQRWLREIKFVYVNVQPIIYTGELKASYYQPLINQSTISIRKKFDTWEDALEEGLKEALKLI